MEKTISENGIIEPCLVLHVKVGYSDRAAHIEKMLSRLRINFEFFTDGDIADMNDEIRNKVFSGPMMNVSPALQSCTYKHLLAYDYILKRGWDGALILEDDISLRKDFVCMFNRSIHELKNNYDSLTPLIVSYDGSRLRFVPYSERQKGKILYPGPHDRLAGAYYINAAACLKIIDVVNNQKFHLPIDGFHTYMIRQNQINYFWSEPPLAVQGSFNGDFQSSLSVRHKWLGKYYGRMLVWRLKTAYRRLLYRFR